MITTETPEEYAQRKKYVGLGILEEYDGYFQVSVWTMKGDEVYPLPDLKAFRSGARLPKAGERVAFDPVVDSDGWTCATNVRRVGRDRFQGFVRIHPSGRLYVRRAGPQDGDCWLSDEDAAIYAPGDLVFYRITWTTDSEGQATDHRAVDVGRDS